MERLLNTPADLVWKRGTKQGNLGKGCKGWVMGVLKAFVVGLRKREGLGGWRVLDRRRVVGEEV